jgi:translation initiation factor IF-3
VSPPRRFDRTLPERDSTRINERIRVPKVRLIDADGAQIGVVDTEQAMAMARDKDLDLVEVAPDARPPVTRLLDYSKYKYELEQKAKQARKHQQQVTIREIKLRPKIATHDYETKRGHVERFLRGNNKVKVTIMFRGREQAHPERGRMLLERLFEDISDLAVIEQHPLQEGRNMHMMLAPARGVATQRQDDASAEAPAEVPAPAEAEAPTEEPAPAEAEAPAEDPAPAEAEAPSEDPAPAEAEAPPAEDPAAAPADEAATA